MPWFGVASESMMVHGRWPTLGILRSHLLLDVITDLVAPPPVSST